jgi:hypothetical protein
VSKSPPARTPLASSPVAKSGFAARKPIAKPTGPGRKPAKPVSGGPGTRRDR